MSSRNPLARRAKPPDRGKTKSPRTTRRECDHYKAETDKPACRAWLTPILLSVGFGLLIMPFIVSPLIGIATAPIGYGLIRPVLRFYYS